MNVQTKHQCRVTAVETEEKDDPAANFSGEYDPRLDFKPIIDVADEIEVKNGEEDEQHLWSLQTHIHGSEIVEGEVSVI